MLCSLFASLTPTYMTNCAVTIFQQVQLQAYRSIGHQAHLFHILISIIIGKLVSMSLMSHKFISMSLMSHKFVSMNEVN